MKVVIELDENDAYTAIGQRLLSVLAGDRLETVEPIASGRGIGGSPDELSDDEATGSGSTDPGENSPGRESPEADEAEALIAKLDGGYKRAKTVTLKGGAQGKEGTEVITGDGEVGIIEACYRGRAVVSFDDGRAEEIGSSNLTVVPDGDEQPPEEKQEETKPAGRRRRKAAEEGDDEGDELVKLCAKVDDAVVGSLLQEFEVDSLAALDGEDREEFLEIIKEELA